MIYNKNLLVTGGCGFIGSNFIRRILERRPGWCIINLDALTYAGNAANLKDLAGCPNYHFVHGDIGDRALLFKLFNSENLEAVVHFAAESHVDRSIHGPETFIQTNIVGTYALLEAFRQSWESRNRPDNFRFLHVSTDEVYGSLGPQGRFSEATPYDPSSPYSATKAGSDHLVNAWHRTYGLPTMITNCSNNYGPFQFPEKLIPLMVLNILEEKPLPVYGDGKNVRDWLYVIDHCDALLTVMERGKVGETYNIGGNEEWRNIEIVDLLCGILDQKLTRSGPRASRNLIQFVPDRPGHDRRYAIDATKIKTRLGWQPGYTFTTAVEETIDWYLNNLEWVNTIRSGEYRAWIDQNYTRRTQTM